MSSTTSKSYHSRGSSSPNEHLENDVSRSSSGSITTTAIHIELGELSLCWCDTGADRIDVQHAAATTTTTCPWSEYESRYDSESFIIIIAIIIHQCTTTTDPYHSSASEWQSSFESCFFPFRLQSTDLFTNTTTPHSFYVDDDTWGQSLRYQRNFSDDDGTESTTANGCLTCEKDIWDDMGSIRSIHGCSSRCH